MQSKYVSVVCRMHGFFYFGAIVFDDEIVLINKMIYKLSPSYYKVPVRFKQNEVIYGFDMPTCANNFKISYDVYLE